MEYFLYYRNIDGNKLDKLMGIKCYNKQNNCS